MKITPERLLLAITELTTQSTKPFALNIECLKYHEEFWYNLAKHISKVSTPSRVKKYAKQCYSCFCYNFKNANKVSNTLRNFSSNLTTESTGLAEIPAANEVLNDNRVRVECKKHHRNVNAKVDFHFQGTFKISSNFWKKYLVNGNRLKRGWCDDFISNFATVFPNCVLAIRWHKCYFSSKIGKRFFYAVAKCKNSACTEFRFERLRNSLGQISVSTRGEIVHDGSEVHRRFICGDRRLHLSQMLKCNAPSSLKLIMITMKRRTK